MDTHRSITLTLADGVVEATNRRGATLLIHPDGTHGFTPVELFLAAIGSCGAIDVDLLMRKQRDPVARMTLTVEGHKVDARMTDLRVTYDLAGDHDPRKVERAVSKTAEDLCTVSRTLATASPVTHEVHP
jgi:putative redox protein